MRALLLTAVTLAACGQTPSDIAGLYEGRLAAQHADGSTELARIRVRVRPLGTEKLTLDDGFCILQGKLDGEDLDFPAAECTGQDAADNAEVVWRPGGTGRARLGSLTYDLSGERTRTPPGGQTTSDVFKVRFVGDWIGP